MTAIDTDTDTDTGNSGMRVEACSVSRAFASGRTGVAGRVAGRVAGSVAALDGVSLVLARGEFVALAGRSGSGKTTLLTLLAGMLRPTSGRVLLDDRDPAAIPRAELTRLTREIGIVFQSAPLLPRTPVWENVTCGLVARGVPPGERRAAALRQLARVQLDGLEERRPEQLSAGQRQRVALARATVHAPRLLLADEPTSDLDPESAAIVSDVLAAEHARGCTVLAASHDGDLLARAQRALHLDAGRLTS